MKHILFCFFTTLALSGIGQINLDSGLVACYPLNAGAADLKNGHNGVLYSVGHAQDRFGKSKRAVYFDGTPGCYAELPNHFDLKGNSVAFSAWVNAVGVSNNGNYIIFTKNNNPNGPANIEAYSMNIEGSPGSYKLRVKQGDGTSFSTLTSLSNYTPGIWQHVYFAIDNSVLSLYLNGILQGTTMAMPNFSYDTNAKVLLGSSKFSFGSAPFIGYMDNVKFYNRILAPAEVAQLYSQDPNCISVTQPPISGFSTSPPCINTPISFFDTSLPGVDFWEWSVTSGTVSDPYVPNPNFTASTASDYTITLISENDFGSDTISQAIHLNPLPQMSVTCSPMNFICQWDTVTFIMNGNATTYTASIKNLSTPSMGTFSCTGISTCSWPPNHYMGTYLLRASGTNSYGCLGQSDSLYVKVNVCEHLPDAIDENELNEFVGIYPNPGKKIIMVKKPFALCKYDLIDITGATVLNGELKEGPKAIIDLGEKPPGIYFLQINADGKTVTKKIVKSD